MKKINRTRQGVAVLGTLALMAIAVPAVAAGSFAVVVTPNVGTNHNELHAVAAASSSVVFAVGETYNGVVDRSLILKRVGTSWSANTAPYVTGSQHNTLYGVAAANANLAYAVGTYYKSTSKTSYSLIEKYVSGKWSVVPTASPAGIIASELDAVTVASATSVWAVGSNHGLAQHPRPLVMHFNGKVWQNIVIPNPGKVRTGTFTATLSGVSVIPGTSGKQIWAVGTFSNGTYTQPFFDRWNGLAWKQFTLSTSVKNYLNALHTTSPLVYPASYATDLQSVASSVTSVSATNAWTVGYYIVTHLGPTYSNRTFTAHWNGTKWSMVISPNISTSLHNNELVSVASRGANDIIAVGRYFPSPYDQTLVLQWTGTAWTVIASANVSTQHHSLEGVAMLPTTGAVTVGTYYNGVNDRTLVEVCPTC
jgi:hypothetical protein